MLSRVANSLYWMSRYIERAENIARIVDVNLQLLLDLRNLDEERLAALAAHRAGHRRRKEFFQAASKKATGQAVTEFLVFQTENPNSIVQVHLPGARKRPHGARPDHHRALGGIEPAVFVCAFAAGAQGLEAKPQRIFPGNQGRLAAPDRHRYATLIHNEGWWFVQTGQFLERADKTSRILDVRYQTCPSAARRKA
jgi:uncharacterized alpha-E superfamily protein